MSVVLTATPVSGDGVTTLNVVFPSAPTQGHLIVIWCTGTTVAPTLSGFSVDVTPDITPTNTISVILTKIAGPSEGTTYGLSFTSAADAVAGGITESGIAASSYFDQQSYLNSGTTSVSSQSSGTSGTTAQATEVAYAVSGRNDTNAATFSSNNSFSLVHEKSGGTGINASGAFFRKELSATGTVEATVSNAAGGTSRASTLVATYKSGGPQTYEGTGASSVAVTLSGTGKATHKGTGAVAAAVTLSAIGKATHKGTGAVGVVVTLSATGEKAPHRGQGASSVTVSLTGDGKATHKGQGAVSVVVTTTATGQPIHKGQGSVSATVALSATGHGVRHGTGAVAVTVALAGTGRPTHKGQGTTGIVVALSGTGHARHKGQGSVSVTVTVSGTGEVAGGPTVLDATGSGAIRSGQQNASYATARSGVALEQGALFLVGQFESVGLVFYACYEGFVAFDLSGIPSTDEVTAVELSMYQVSNSGSGTIEVRAHPWGPTLTTADWVAGDSVGSLTLLASVNNSSTGIYIDFTSETAFIDAVQAAVTGGQSLYLLLHSANFRAGNPPSPDTFNVAQFDAHGDANPPQLTVTHQASAPAHEGQGASSVTVTVSGTGKATHKGQAALDVDVTLSGTGQRTRHGQASSQVAVTLSGTGHARHKAQGALTVTVALSGTGQARGEGTGQGSITITVTLSATGQQRRFIHPSHQKTQVTSSYENQTAQTIYANRSRSGTYRRASISRVYKNRSRS